MKGEMPIQFTLGQAQPLTLTRHCAAAISYFLDDRRSYFWECDRLYTPGLYTPGQLTATRLNTPRALSSVH